MAVKFLGNPIEQQHGLYIYGGNLQTELFEIVFFLIHTKQHT